MDSHLSILFWIVIFSDTVLSLQIITPKYFTCLCWEVKISHMMFFKTQIIWLKLYEMPATDWWPSQVVLSLSAQMTAWIGSSPPQKMNDCARCCCTVHIWQPGVSLHLCFILFTAHHLWSVSRTQSRCLEFTWLCRGDSSLRGELTLTETEQWVRQRKKQQNGRLIINL